MHQAPEGLEYSHDNDKFAKTPINNNYKELGKILTGEKGRAPEYKSVMEAAEKMRMHDGGCCDPMYKDQNKNK